MNGQKIFLRGGNWIGTDAMLRLSDKRYDDEVRMHAEMNMNLIRVWGGSIAERPEFYAACDRHGMLIMQDFWRSGEYPLDNSADIYGKPDTPPNALGTLFLACLEDTTKMLRNHPSLMFWCAGNELPTNGDYFFTLMQARLAQHDPSRIMVDRSTNISGANTLQYADGRYGMIEPGRFFNPQPDDRESNALNPEIGYVGVPVAASIRKMMDAGDANLMPIAGATTSETADSNAPWAAHYYANYNNGYAPPKYPEGNPNAWDYIYAFGQPADLDGFCGQAQMANYIENKALFEGAAAQMWTQNIGIMVWKSQNPFPALSGQLYDNFLQPTGGFYGARKACEPHHVQLNLQHNNNSGTYGQGENFGQIEIVNTSMIDLENVTVIVTGYAPDGKIVDLGIAAPLEFPLVKAMSVASGAKITPPTAEVYFVTLDMHASDKTLVSRNFYWMPVSFTDLSALSTLKPAKLQMTCQKSTAQTEGFRSFDVTLKNTGTAGQDPVVFSVVLEAMASGTQDLLAPVSFSDNYICIAPQDEHLLTVQIAEADLQGGSDPDIYAAAWNSPKARIWPK